VLGLPLPLRYELISSIARIRTNMAAKELTNSPAAAPPLVEFKSSDLVAAIAIAGQDDLEKIY